MPGGQAEWYIVFVTLRAESTTRRTLPTLASRESQCGCAAGTPCSRWLRANRCAAAFGGIAVAGRFFVAAFGGIAAANRLLSAAFGGNALRKRASEASSFPLSLSLVLKRTTNGNRETAREAEIRRTVRKRASEASSFLLSLSIFL